MRLAAHLHEQGELPSAFVVVSEEEDPQGIPPDGPVDAEVRSTDAGTKGQVLLRAQVVRAARGEILHVLGGTGSYDNGTTVADLADLLRGSVDKKAKRYPPVEMSKIHLVLEALDHQAPVSAQPVVDQFRLHHAGNVKSKGFIAIWLVGPTEIYRLDE
ncbi:hypothetical protein JKA73_24500 [Myxococcus xanthus]|uniref:hypothetical protein n=1 Tax=Myxococcus xanthus TaxID=34 RepID=UPI0019177870|nr:hypothetical protein [Myxococcus xanthus]QQR42271.1 hypothetical protein JKA73_24500 [Myxococcus xanthus]